MSSKGAVPPDYGDPSYWDERYTAERRLYGADFRHDWYFDYEQCKQTLAPHLRPTDRILVVGCGNSSLPESLWDSGFRSVTAVDFSTVVVNQMRAAAKDREGLECGCCAPSRAAPPVRCAETLVRAVVCADARDMEHFTDESFDLVLGAARRAHCATVRR